MSNTILLPTPLINTPQIQLPNSAVEELLKKLKANQELRKSYKTYSATMSNDITADLLAEYLKDSGITAELLIDWNGGNTSFAKGTLVRFKANALERDAVLAAMQNTKNINRERIQKRLEYADKYGSDIRRTQFMNGQQLSTNEDIVNNAGEIRNDALSKQLDRFDQNSEHLAEWNRTNAEIARQLRNYNENNKLTSKKLITSINDARNTAGKYGMMGVGIIGGAIALPALAGEIPAIKTIAPHIPGMIRDYLIYDKVVNPTVRTVTDKYMDDGLMKDVVNEAASFAGTNLLSGLYRAGKRTLLTKASNYLDNQAGLWGSLLGDNIGKYVTEGSNSIRNYINYTNMTSGNPNIIANTIKGAGIGVGMVGIDKGLDALEVENPLIREGVKLGAMAITPTTSGWLGKRLSLNSGGALTGRLAISNLFDSKKTKYDLNDPLYAVKGLGNKTGTGNFVKTRGVEGDNVMHTWSKNVEGTTYNSPYWDQVNPEAKFANEAYEFFYRPGSTMGNAYRARRPLGSTVEIKSAQSLPEFKTLADNLVSNGRTLSLDISNRNTLNLHHTNSDIKIANSPKLGLGLGIFRNEKGHIESGLYTDLFGNNVVSRSDYGGTGSGGNEGFIWNSDNSLWNNLSGWTLNKGVRIMKHHIDALRSLPVSINNAITKKVKINSKNGFGISTNNNVAYHIDNNGNTYLPIFNGNIGSYGLFHKRGGKLGIK